MLESRWHDIAGKKYEIENQNLQNKFLISTFPSKGRDQIDKFLSLQQLFIFKFSL